MTAAPKPPRPTRQDPGCTCAIGDAVEYHGHRDGCPVT